MLQRVARHFRTRSSLNLLLPKSEPVIHLTLSWFGKPRLHECLKHCG